ncbi:hypothetical protein KS4_21490 [Poriferisphaera corsica]|uniref:Uncharacterized protein n=1 Tax=Poriferisphaera corsica TaxID=2528020 RepID=A0A517YV40_9BACT|nr:hypothetical protein KS4_21490 [Poriferisphaera corsica]
MLILSYSIIINQCDVILYADQMVQSFIITLVYLYLYKDRIVFKTSVNSWNYLLLLTLA